MMETTLHTDMDKLFDTIHELMMFTSPSHIQKEYEEVLKMRHYIEEANEVIGMEYDKDTDTWVHRSTKDEKTVINELSIIVEERPYCVCSLDFFCLYT